MPFLAESTIPIPAKSIYHWYFDNPVYDLNKPIYIDAAHPERFYSGAECKVLIRKLARGLAEFGIAKGHCVSVLSFNDINYPLLVNGIAAAGAVFAGANPSYTPSEFAHHLKTAKVRLVIVEPEMLPTATKAAAQVGLKQSQILVFDHASNGGVVPRGFRSWRELAEHGEAEPVELSEEQSKRTTAARLFSSGTTGMPKAAELSHYNMIAQHELVEQGNERVKPWIKRAVVPLPLFHVAAVTPVHFSALRSGAQIFLMRRFDASAWLRNVQKYEANELACVPPIVIAAINAPEASPEVFRTIRYATCGAAPLDKRPQARLKALLPKEAVFGQVWGMTEVSCIGTQVPWPRDDPTGSVGAALPNLDLKLVDDDGNDITDYDVRGELCARGPTVISGYFENARANKRDWDKDGYFHTGDIGYRSRENGWWYIVDRKKELIKVRGFQVAPPEIEGVLLDHPLIADAAVIGVTRDKNAGELPRAYVVRKSDELDEAGVKKWIGEKLAKYKQVEGGVVFLEQIPKNPSGKILKRVLRDMAEKEARKSGAKL